MSPLSDREQPPPLAVEALLGPAQIDNFVRGISSRPRVFPGVGAPFVDLLTLQDIDRLLTVCGLRPPFVSLVNSKTGLRSTDYNIYHEPAAQCSSPGSILREYLANGTTIIIQHIHLVHASIAALTAYLAERLFPMSLQTNCYLTPGTAQGVEPHVDQHHTFLLQLSGRKRWLVWQNIDQDPLQPMINVGVDSELPRRIAETSPPLLDEWVQPGDFILMPRGFVHTPYTGEEHSLHITFGIIDPGTDTASELMYRQLTADAPSLAFGRDSEAAALGDANSVKNRAFFRRSGYVEVV